MNDLQRITNANGGGLSHAVTGKYTSVRHEQATRNPNKLTAGEAAKAMRKAGHKVAAKELRELYRLVFHKDPEWHHSGFYKGGNGSTMGRTWFYRQEEVDAILNAIPKMEALKKAQEEVDNAEVFGIYYSWDKDYGGNYGKARKFKRLEVYNGTEKHAPRGLVRCDKQQYEAAKAKVGQPYYGWDEPRLSEFTT